MVGVVSVGVVKVVVASPLKCNSTNRLVEDAGFTARTVRLKRPFFGRSAF